MVMYVYGFTYLYDFHSKLCGFVVVHVMFVFAINNAMDVYSYSYLKICPRTCANFKTIVMHRREGSIRDYRSDTVLY